VPVVDAEFVEEVGEAESEVELDVGFDVGFELWGSLLEVVFLLWALRGSGGGG